MCLCLCFYSDNPAHVLGSSMRSTRLRTSLKTVSLCLKRTLKGPLFAAGIICIHDIILFIVYCIYKDTVFSFYPCSPIVSQAIRIFPRAHARGKGGGGREGKIRLVRCARFSFRLPECWQSQSNSSIQSN